MMRFNYLAVDNNGTRIKGALDCESYQSAAEELAARGLFALSIKQSNPVWTAIQKRFLTERVRRIDVIELSNSLSVMVGAGIPITTALGDIITSTSNPTLQNIMREIKQQVERGSSFSDAVDRHQDIFPDIFIRLVRVGEETGRFEKSLADTGEHLQRMEDLSASIKRALMYPVFAIVTTLGALGFWLIYVLPKIIGTLKSLGVKLPLITRILMAASDFTQKYWYLFPISALAIFILFQLVKKNEKVSLQIDSIKLKFPIYALIEYNRLLALFAEQMRILIVSGLTVDRTLGIINNVMHNKVFQKAISEIRNDITYGSTISSAMGKHPVFPMLVIRLVGIGETSGTLDNQFSFLATHYLKKLDDISEKLGKIIEPVVIGLIGVVFAVIIAGLLLPVYDLVSKIGKG